MRLLELLGGFDDLGVDVDAVFDVEEDGGGGGYGEDDAAGGARVGGGEDGEGGDEFTAEGGDGLGLGGNGVVGGGVIGLDVDWVVIRLHSITWKEESIPFASSFREYSAIRDLMPFETPRTSSYAASAAGLSISAS